jgi:hypothetical protein
MAPLRTVITIAVFSIFVSCCSVDIFKRDLKEYRVAQRQASLNNCNLPPEHIVPNEYIVYLATGYSLKDHKRTVGAALPEGSIEVVQRLHSNAAVWYSAKARS